MDSDRRRGSNWTKHNFIGIIGLFLIFCGYIWWVSSWSRHVDEALSNLKTSTATKEEFIRMEDKLNSYADKVDKLDCRIYDGCYAQPSQKSSEGYSVGGVHHP